MRLQTIVVDNASSDGSAEMIAGEFPEVLLKLNPRNLGFSVANNSRRTGREHVICCFSTTITLVPPGAG